jgi:single-stranded DNA-binding protein
VVCYDPFIVEKRAQYLKKGSYVIITGQIISEVNRGNGNIYLNHHVTASTVEMPRLGRREETDASQDNGNEPLVSVYTGKTASEKTYAPREISTQPAPAYAPSA